MAKKTTGKKSPRSTRSTSRSQGIPRLHGSLPHQGASRQVSNLTTRTTPGFHPRSEIANCRNSGEGPHNQHDRHTRHTALSRNCPAGRITDPGAMARAAPRLSPARKKSGRDRIRQLTVCQQLAATRYVIRHEKPHRSTPGIMTRMTGLRRTDRSLQFACASLRIRLALPIKQFFTMARAMTCRRIMEMPCGRFI